MAIKKDTKKRKSNKRILKRMQRKLWFVFGAVCVLFVVLIGRLMWIQYSSGDRYEKIVLAQQDYDSTLIPFQRGNIIDSKGSTLATSVDVYNVILDCKVLNSYQDSIPSTVNALTTCFSKIDSEKVYSKLRDNPTSQYVVLAKKVSYEEMASFLELKTSDLYKGKINGIWFEKEYIRQYPYGSLAAATLGFTSSGNVGVIGLENYYSSTLNGINGRTYGYLNSDSNLEQTTIEAINGNNIVVSLDVNIQSIVEKAIEDWNADFATPENNNHGCEKTAAIVMNPNTGEIYAMAQYPEFDLTNPYDLSEYFTEEQLEEMSEDDKLERLNAIWQNTAVTYTYEPGSTAKPFTVACGLETGALTGNETYYCDGGEMVKGYPKEIHCVNTHGHGMQTIADSLSNSCNDALMQMSYSIGYKSFADYQSLFGIGQKTGIDLPGETSTAGLIYDEEGLKSAVNLATNSFGQNFNVTMVQMAAGFSSVINGGNYYQPHLVTKITDSTGNTVKEIEPVLLKKTISEETSAQMRDYLYNVVKNGTGKTAGVAGYTIGGKTGTAEKQPRALKNYVVSFIGFAPVDNPQVVVYVIIDTPNTKDQPHSSYAQTIVHSIFEQILPYLNIQPEDASAYEEAMAKEAAQAAAEEKQQMELTPAGN